MSDTEAAEVTKEQSGGASNAGGDSRDRWSSRLAFYGAAVGSAVGFGNVWRFPALAQDYGNGAFFVPYLLALFLIGIPVLFLEVALGQFYQSGDVGVFGSFHKRFRGVGFSSICCGFIVVSYYSMLLAWVLHAFFDSWSSDAPWTDPDVTAKEAKDYMFNEIIGMKTLGGNLRPTRLVGANAGYSLLGWTIIFLCVAFGVKSVGRITYVTMGLPIIFLFVFLGKGLTLEGAEDGVREYIGDWDMSVLRERGDVWSEAVSQIFFSLSVTFGVMTAYGSHCPRTEPALLNCVVVGISNSMYSIIAGFAVFAALGHLAYLEGTPVDKLPSKSFGLVFGSWPVVFGTLPGGEHWVRLLFVMLFLLGLDSAFSLLEASLTVYRDTAKHTFGKSMKIRVAGCGALLAWGFSLIYATDAGLIFLDTVDFYINFIMIFVGFLETFGCGWMAGIEKQVLTFGKTTVVVYMLTNFGAVIVACGLWFGIDDNDVAVWAGFVGLVGVYVLGMAFVLYQLVGLRKSDTDRWPSLGSIVWELAFGNMMDLKEAMQPVVGPVPLVWCILVKQFIPHILLFLFVNLAQTETDAGKPNFGNYEGYVQWPFQGLGYMAFGFACLLFLIGFCFPKAYEMFDTSMAKYEGKALDVSDPDDDDEVEEQVKEVGDEAGDEEPKEEGEGIEVPPPKEDA